MGQTIYLDAVVAGDVRDIPYADALTAARSAAARADAFAAAYLAAPGASPAELAAVFDEADARYRRTLTLHARPP